MESPESDSLSRYRLMEMLNFVSTELHKSFGALFNDSITEAHRNYQIDLINKRCGTLSQILEQKPYLMGDNFSVADVYLFAVLNWSNLLNVDLTSWPVITNYITRIMVRSNVKQAMKAEGLVD